MLGKEGNNDKAINQTNRVIGILGGGWVFLFFIVFVVFYSLYSSSLFCQNCRVVFFSLLSQSNRLSVFAKYYEKAVVVQR